MKTVQYEDKVFQISENAWETHKLMHPVRSEESLIKNINIVLSDNNFSEKDIERMIYDEYNIHFQFANVLKEAENICESRHI